MKKLIIFGATGNTGLAATAAAIDKGYAVTVFVRNPEKLPSSLKVSSVVQGDATKADDVDAAVKNQDHVLSILGTGMNLEATTVISAGTTNILNAMKKHNVKRISCCLSSFMFWERSKIPERVMKVHEDHERALQALKDSDREWIAVCPPHISSDPARGDYKTALDGPVGKMISKFDLGEILVDALSKDDWVHHLVGMGYPQ